MDRSTARTVAAATVAFLALLAAVTAVAWSFQPPTDRSVETIYVVVALSPFVFYLFASDKLKQFKGVASNSSCVMRPPKRLKPPRTMPRSRLPPHRAAKSRDGARSSTCWTRAPRRWLL